MGGLFKKPKTPSPTDVARASLEETPNVFGPGFRSTTTFNPGTGKHEQRFAETGRQKRLTDQRGLIASTLGTTATNLARGLPGTSDAASQAAFDRAQSFLAPQQEQQRRSVMSNLVNSGNPIGTERARLTLDQLNRDQSARQNDLALAAVDAGQRARGQDIGQLGGLFSIMQADRAPFLVGQSPLSPALAGALASQPKGASPLAGLGSLLGGAIGGKLGGVEGAGAGSQIGGAAGTLFG